MMKSLKKIYISQETFIICVKLPVTCDTVKLMDQISRIGILNSTFNQTTEKC